MNKNNTKDFDKLSMELISKHLQQVLDEVTIITEELEEMKARGGGEH